jgi:hypothetical protein
MSPSVANTAQSTGFPLYSRLRRWRTVCAKSTLAGGLPFPNFPRLRCLLSWFYRDSSPESVLKASATVSCALDVPLGSTDRHFNLGYHYEIFPPTMVCCCNAGSAGTASQLCMRIIWGYLFLHCRHEWHLVAEVLADVR